MCEYIRRFSEIENRFLQILLYDFELTRIHKDGVCLSIDLDWNAPAIWSSQGKHRVLAESKKYPDDLKNCASVLNQFLLQGLGTNYSFSRLNFPFRYGNGGTLPVLRYRNKIYYCLFYREIHPIGWNICNGGADSRYELLNPFETIEREFHEELVVLNPSQKKRYVFRGDVDKPVDRLEFAAARRIISRRFPHLDFNNLEVEELAFKWLGGPDQVIVHADGPDPLITKDCFININAEDLGIEIDRVAWLNIEDDAVLCDGEIIDNVNQIVNAPIGLFEMNRFNEAIMAGERRFVPDLFFHGAQLYDQGDQIENHIRLVHMPSLRGIITREEEKEYDQASDKFNLCPVTRSLVTRYLKHLESHQHDPAAPPLDLPAADSDVFISHSHTDRDIAQRVNDFVKDAFDLNVFFSTHSIHSGVWSKQIDEAISSEKCQSMILIGSSLDNIRRPWVEYEWRSFHQEIHGNRKQPEGLIPLVGFSIEKAPLALRYYDIKNVLPANYEAALKPALQRIFPGNR